MLQKEFSKMAPSRAMRSIFGVWLMVEPYAPIAWQAWSSEKMKRMLGR